MRLSRLLCRRQRLLVLVPRLSSTVGTSDLHFRSLSASLQSRLTRTTLLPTHRLDLFGSSPTVKQPGLPAGNTGELCRDDSGSGGGTWPKTWLLLRSRRSSPAPPAVPLQETSPKAQRWWAAFPRSWALFGKTQ